MQKEVAGDRGGLGLIVVIALALGMSNAFATSLPITDSGVLQIGNLQGSLVGLTADPFCFNWGGGSTCVAGTTHQMAVSGSSNVFSTAPSASDQIKDLTNFGPLVDFETVLGAGALAGQTVHFDLVSLVLPNGGAGFGNCGSNAANNSCSPAGAPVVLTEDATGTQVTASFTALLDAYTGTNSNFTPYRGLFTTQFSGTLVGAGACNGLAANITNIVGCEGNQGTIRSTWSATESPIPPVPEPRSTALLLGSSLLGFVVYKRRSFRRAV